CKVVVVVLSDLAQDSIWIPKEVGRALSHKKPVIPFHIDESDLRDPFLFFLSDSQRIEAYKGLADAFSQLLTVLTKIIGTPINAPSSSTSEIIDNTSQTCNSKKTVNYHACKIYIASDEGSICFASNDIQSYDDICYLDFSGELKDGFTIKLRNVLSCLYQVNAEDVSIVYSSKNQVRLIPSAEPYWSAWSVEEAYKIRFKVQHFESEKELPYDSLHFELNSDLEVSFFYHGEYIHKPGDPIKSINSLGISEERTIHFATELIAQCFPKKQIGVQRRFVPIFYSDCSGGYHLTYLLA
nr:hypothetical protein [Clostridiales bacterium]